MSAIQRNFARAALIPTFALLVMLPACKDREREGGYSEPYPPRPGYAPYVTSPVPAPSIVISTPAIASANVPDIRVAVIKDAPGVRIGAGTSGARILLNGQPWRQLQPGTSVNVSFSGTTMLLEGQPANAASVRFESFLSEDSLKVNDRDTASRVTVSRPANRAGLLAVAQLNVEEYLAGVLAGEVPYNTWHPEALKAQTVVSRTYALYEIRGHAAEPYDVESTVASQVFKSGYKNVPALSAAINATRGQALTSGGQVFSAYFHSTCGGRTEPASGIFPEHAGVRPLCGTNCPYCAQSPAYRWNVSLSKETIAQKLRAQVPNMGRIEAIAFADAKGIPIGGSPTDLRRVQTVSIKHINGLHTMQGNAFRLAVGARELKSLLFGQIADRGDTLDIGGGGYGHGVGLCQYGSQGMAQSGQPFTSILGYYYPGAAMTKMY